MSYYLCPKCRRPVDAKRNSTSKDSYGRYCGKCELEMSMKRIDEKRQQKASKKENS